MAQNLPMLVISRILQGLFGGGLLAKAQSILFETFPPHQHSQAQAIFGVGVIVGPVVGPTLGGYLTDAFNWRWIFLINIPFGILAVILSGLFLPNMEPSRQVKRIDWLGILFLVMFLGCFQTFLEQGNQDDWFSSRFITTLFIGAMIGLGLFLWRELKTRTPAVDLRVLRHRSLSAGSVFSFILGIGLYGALFAVPVFAQTFLHYTAMQTGMLLLPGALASGCMMPILGFLTKRLDARLLIGGGSVLTAVTMLMLGHISPSTNEDSLFVPLLLRGIATSMMFLPLSLTTIGPLPREDIGQASGFYNLTRQMGGSVGVAVLTTMLSWRENFHRTILAANINPYNPALQTYLVQLTGMFESKGFDPVLAQKQAYKMLDAILSQQAAVMAFGDLFWLVAIVFICSTPLLFFLGKGRGGAPAGVH
jgi:DHA2 family multidrug resistance protein